MANNNVLPPGLLATPLGLQNGVITSPAWLAFFNQILFPILGIALNSQFSISDLLVFRGPYPAQEPNSDLNLPASTTVYRGIPDLFPPQTRTAFEPDMLAMLSATKTGTQPLPWVISDTHANRAKYPNSAFQVDMLFVETDRLLIYRNTGAAWVYVAGTYTDTLANIPTLGTNDAGLLFGVSDYAHLLKWSGTAWGWGPGDHGSGMMTVFEIDPGTGWHLYDGTAGVAYLKADGTTGTVTLPDLTSSGALAAFMDAGGTNSGPTAATAPTFTGTPVTPTGTNSAPVFTGTPKTWDVVSVPVTSPTQSVLKDDVTNNPYTPAGSVSAPAFTGDALTPAGTVSATGEPRKIVRRPFFRQ